MIRELLHKRKGFAFVSTEKNGMDTVKIDKDSIGTGDTS